MTKIVSVIVPCYNVFDTIGETLASVYKQSYSNWELILVNDASTDQTSTVLAEAENGRYQEKIRIVDHNVNCGLGATRNTALKIARGDYIAFLDGDDLWDENYLKSGVELLDRVDAQVSMVYSKIKPFGEFSNRSDSSEHSPSGRFKGHFAMQLYCYCFFIPSAVIIRRQVYEEVGGFREDRSMEGMEDHDYWLRCLDAAFSFEANTSTACHYRRHAESMTLKEQKVSYAWKRVRHRHSLLSISCVPLYLRIAYVCTAYFRLMEAYLKMGLRKIRNSFVFSLF